MVILQLASLSLPSTNDGIIRHVALVNRSMAENSSLFETVINDIPRNANVVGVRDAVALVQHRHYSSTF